MISVHEASKLWNISERRITLLCREGKLIGAKKEGKCWYINENCPRPVDGRFKKEEEVIASNDTVTKYTYAGAYSNVINAFKKTYNKAPIDVAYTPYRICPLGAHSDHQFGKITGFAIDKGIYIAYAGKQNGVVEMQSLQFPKRAQWHVLSMPVEKQNDWADHLRGATIALAKRYNLRIGICAIIDGELPIGGLSSSASVIITFLNALSRLNNIKLSREEMITISKEAENDYVGVSCGKLDQSCEVYCRKDHLLYLDTKDDSYRLIPTNPKAKPFEFIIFFSGLERSLSSSKFNMRVDECRSAAYALKAFANMEYGKFEETNLRDVPLEVFNKYKDKLPINWRKRAEHYYTEYERVEKGAKAYEEGDIEKFGKLCFESGYSSIHSWETGSKELIKLYEIMCHTEGIYGGRFSGAGFKGCCMAIVDPKYEQSIIEKVSKEYLAVFPHLKGKYSAHVCHSADGTKL